MPTLPYVPEAYDYGPTSRIAEMMLRAAQQQAQARYANAENLGRGIANVGEAVGGVMQAREAGKRDAQLFRLMENPNATVRDYVNVGGPELGVKVYNAQAAARKAATLAPEDALKLLPVTLDGYFALPDGPARDQAYQGMLQTYGTVLPVQGFPKQRTPEVDPILADIQKKLAERAAGPANMKLEPTSAGLQPFDPRTGKLGDVVAQPATEAPKPGEFGAFLVGKFGQNPTPDQQTEARRLWAEAGREPEDPTAAALNKIKLQEAQGAIAGRAALGKLPPELVSAADVIAVGLPGTKQEALSAAMRRAAETGKPEQAQAVLRKAAISGMSASEQAALQGRIAMIDSLDDISSMMQEAKSVGAEPGFFAGSIEDVARRFGQTNNPKLRELGTRMRVALNNYVRAQSGAAFSEKELKNYEFVMPSWQSGIAANEATIRGMRRAISDWNNSSWSFLLQDEGLAKAIGAIKEIPSAGGGWTDVGNGVRVRLKPGQ